MQNSINEKILILAEETISNINDGTMRIRNIQDRVEVRNHINRFYEKKNEIYKKDCVAQIEQLMSEDTGT